MRLWDALLVSALLCAVLGSIAAGVGLAIFYETPAWLILAAVGIAIFMAG